MPEDKLIKVHSQDLQVEKQSWLFLTTARILFGEQKPTPISLKPSIAQIVYLLCPYMT